MSSPLRDWYNVKKNTKSKAVQIVKLFDGAPVWKLEYIYVKAQENFCVAWDYQETHELDVIVDDWTRADKAKIEKYRADINAMEDYENFILWTDVQHYIPPVPVEGKEDEHLDDQLLDAPEEHERGIDSDGAREEAYRVGEGIVPCSSCLLENPRRKSSQEFSNTCHDLFSTEEVGVVNDIATVRSVEKDIVDAVQAYTVQIHSRLVQRFKQREEDFQCRLHQYNLDFHNSLALEANVSEEMTNL
ncbi:OLC1v1017117C1 [Oldenlandia corymbosa var. corymbosa]|uniref:OLC1v1017117C1 n=1 Tax=Oldenlandia corymbosa var. corymbosa TaxID=529605 RepID=A0AAV1E8R4_OLDCO|nr:OLC1v1017117C1 [Oldenlandia corymbosa var. corymbosa]